MKIDLNTEVGAAPAAVMVEKPYRYRPFRRKNVTLYQKIAIPAHVSHI